MTNHKPLIHIINRQLPHKLLLQIINRNEQILLMTDGIYYINILPEQRLNIIADDLQARLPDYKINESMVTLIDFNELVQLAIQYTLVTW